MPRSSGLPKIWGPFFWEKKAPAATCPEAQGFQKNLGPFFKNILSRNRLNRLLIYPIMVTKKSIWSKSHSGYCFRLPLALNPFEPAISGHSGQVRLPLCQVQRIVERYQECTPCISHHPCIHRLSQNGFCDVHDAQASEALCTFGMCLAV